MNYGENLNGNTFLFVVCRLKQNSFYSAHKKVTFGAGICNIFGFN